MQWQLFHPAETNIKDVSDIYKGIEMCIYIVTEIIIY